MLKASKQSSEDIEYMVKVLLFSILSHHNTVMDIFLQIFFWVKAQFLWRVSPILYFSQHIEYTLNRWKICQLSYQGMQWWKRQSNGEKNKSNKHIMLPFEGLRLNSCVFIYIYTYDCWSFLLFFKITFYLNQHFLYSLRWVTTLRVVVVVRDIISRWYY